MTLAEKYNEAMNRIELSDEARARILGGVWEELNKPARSKIVQFSQWKRWASIAACAVVVLFTAVTLNPRNTLSPDGSLDQQGGVQIASPIWDYDSIDAAAQAVGFTLTAPESVEGYGEKSVQVIDGGMIQIIFSNGSENRLFIRKQAGTADISGDYNSYAEVKTESVDGCDVTFKGNNGAVSTAIWTNGGYSYAVMSDAPMNADAMAAIIAQIR